LTWRHGSIDKDKEPMKRSATATLLLMAATPMVMTACSDDSTPKVLENTYANVLQCTTAGNPQAECERAQKSAQANADGAAPKYKTREECVQDFGDDKCVERTDRREGSIWGPLMTGFMISHLMNNMGGRGAFYQSEPLYRRRDGADYRPSTGAGVGAFAGRSFASRGLGTGSLNAPEGAGSRATTVSRGGFGGSGSAGE
jgi:uncharacterized protein YgiB involved in biofilm formation